MPVQWKEEAPSCGPYYRCGTLEDSTMAGMVKASAEVHRDGSVDVYPYTCAVEDVHREDRPRCYVIMFDGERRACPLWIATTMPANDTHRIDASTVATQLVARGATYAPVGVLCQAARRRPGHGC